MTSKEIYSLNWSDFHQNVCSFLKDMKEDLDFVDVTLASEDGKQINAHKVILCASSTFFKYLLKNHKHPHPLIYMKGLKGKDLLSVLDFIYHGEVNVAQEDLTQFLSVAEDLELKGLTGTDNKPNPNLNQTNKITQKTEVSKQDFNDRSNNLLESAPYDTYDMYGEEFSVIETYREKVMTNTSNNFPVNVTNDDVNETIELMLEKIPDGLWQCKMCGKSRGDKTAIKLHIQDVHTVGSSHSCTHCGKIFNKKNSLNLHKSRTHKSTQY